MVNYENSKIYKLVCNVTGKVYIGSTSKKYLSQRMGGHVAHYKEYKLGKHNHCRSFDILENEDFDIILIENFPCNNKDELRKRERFYIESTECINKNIPSRTVHEYKVDYYINNKEIIDQKHKVYDAKNRDKIEAKRSEPFLCNCGMTIRKDSKTRHMKTAKHLEQTNNSSGK